MEKRAIITGISGFVGGFLAEKLLQTRTTILGFSPNGRWLSTSDRMIQDQVQLSAWDFAQSGKGRENDKIIDKEIERFEPDVVYHLAAISVPADCGAQEPTKAAWEINVEGTRRVVESICTAAPKARLVFISSSHVYAPVNPNEPRVAESSPVGPARGYGKTKLAAEQIVLDAVERHQLDAVIARAFQHTGPRQTGRMMLPEWMEQIVNSDEKPIKIHTRNAQIDLLDVRDVVQGYERLAESGKTGTIYNVGSGKIHHTGDLIDRLLEMAGKKRQIIETQPGIKQDPVANITRIQKDTGWEPHIPIDQLLSDTLRWWRGNSNESW